MVIKRPITHVDMVGFDIRAGDYVVGAYGNNTGIAIFIVLSCAPKTISLRKYDVKNPRSNQRRYPKDLIRLNEEQTKNLLFEVIKGT